MIPPESICAAGTPQERQSATTASPCLARRATLPYARWLLLLSLLIAELFAARLRFDTSVLTSPGWASLRSALPLVKQLLLAAAAAIAVFGGTYLRDELLGIADRLRVTRAAWRLLLGHFVSLVATFLVVAHVLEDGLADSTRPWLWVLLLIAMTLVTLGLLLALAIPVGVWPSLLRRGLPTILLGFAIGGGACAAGQFTGSLWKPLSGLTLRLVAVLVAWILPDPMCVCRSICSSGRSGFTFASPRRVRATRGWD